MNSPHPRKAKTDFRGPFFLGLGAQRSGTSWIYACLVEHPRVHMPIKEIHFFSREEGWAKGYEWYESLFASCPPGSLAGEFSTSYLSHSMAAGRIFRRYPEVRLLVTLRNPVDRAYSNFMNDVMSGAVASRQGFFEALRDHPEYLQQSRYSQLLEPYRKLFSREQLLILIYEDIARDPSAFLKRIFSHLGLDPWPKVSMLHRKVNVGHQPRSVALERLLIASSHRFQRTFGHGAWWTAKKLGLGDLFRRLNTRKKSSDRPCLSASERKELMQEFQEDVNCLSGILKRDLEEWRQ